MAGLLLDTRACLWWCLDDPRLSERARETIGAGGHAVYVSAATGWEMAIKSGLGRLQLPGDLETFVADQLRENACRPLASEMRLALLVRRLPEHHHDPFDRLLIAQAIADALSGHVPGHGPVVKSARLPRLHRYRRACSPAPADRPW